MIRFQASILSIALLLAVFGVTRLNAEPMNVTATVQEVCEIGAVGDVVFGNLLPGSGVDAATTGSVQWRCSFGTNANVTINGGGNGDRTMSGPGVTTVAYDLYKEAAHANRWGDTGAEVVTVNGAGMSAFQLLTVYGEVLHDDYVGAEAGGYSDIVTVDIVIF